MKKYVVIALNQFSVNMQYKFNTITVILSKIASLFMYYFVWSGIYSSMSGSKVGGYSRSQMLTYIVLVNMTNLLFTIEHMQELGKKIHNGNLTTLLLRPMSILNESFAVFLGKKWLLLAIYLLGIISAGTAGYFSDLAYFMEVLLLAVLSFIMLFYIISFISTIGFWLIEVWPVQLIFSGIYFILSGVAFPLDILPEKVYRVMKYNPFSLMKYVTVRSIQGAFSHKELLICIVAILIWIVIFRMGYEKAFEMGMRRYEGMGA